MNPKDLYKKEKTYRKEYNDLNIPLKLKFKSLLTGLFFAIIIMAIPISITANCFIFYDVMYVLFGVLIILIDVFLYLVYYFYDKALCEYDNRVVNTHYAFLRTWDYLQVAFLVTLVLFIYFKFIYVF